MKFNNEDNNNDDAIKICNLKATKCLKCEADTNKNDEKEFFCSQCGAPVLNRCSNYECQEILDEKAKFCKYCGSESIFKNYGLFDKVSSFTLTDEDDLPF